jgi:tripartite ATP-independent transporter DctP family solute receptor
MDRRRALQLALAVLLLALTSGGAKAADQKMVFKASDVHPAGYPTVQAVENMGKKLEAATGGRLSIQMYASMQLGGEKEAIEQAQVGALQFARVSVGAVGPVVDDLNVFNLPFLFRSTDHMEKVIDGPIGQELLDKVSNNPNTRLIGLAWMDAGARSVYDTKKPIKGIDDLKGLKVRVMGNPMFVDMMNALGGNGVAMGYDQVFSALQTGVVDGAENNPPSFVFDNHYQVEHLTRAGDPGVFARHLGQPLEGRPGADQKAGPRGATGRTPAVEESRRRGHGQDEGLRHRDRHDCRQDSFPSRGKTGLGQIRRQIQRTDQAHPSR